MRQEPRTSAPIRAVKAGAATSPARKVPRQCSDRNSKTLPEKTRCTQSAATTRKRLPILAAPDEEKTRPPQAARERTGSGKRVPPSQSETGATARPVTRPCRDKDTAPNRNGRIG